MKKAKPHRVDQAFHAGDAEDNQTISAALRAWLPGKSWSDVRSLIESRHVTINGNSCVDSGRRLNAQDVVKVLAQAAPAQPQEHDVRVQYLDEHLIVVEKPAGVTSNRHREEQNWSSRRKQRQPTLDELLPNLIVKLTGRRTQRGVPPPVRAVHRLDRDTSGLMVFARTASAERHLAEQFRRHTTHRRYLAIVVGRVKEQTIKSQLVRDRGDGRRGSVTNIHVGKSAVTHVKPIESLSSYTLVECRLETGRTHQIRIHLSEQGNAVCGDKVYGQPKFAKGPEDRSAAPRLALHAAELGFVHPVSGKVLRFQAPLPQELADFWQNLKPVRPHP